MLQNRIADPGLERVLLVMEFEVAYDVVQKRFFRLSACVTQANRRSNLVQKVSGFDRIRS
jgi:hypothetical protein